jgi:energy-coupling factor transport system substrate-specific component
MRTKDVVLIGMLSALIICVQVALSLLPNVELVTLLFILCTLVYGWRTLFIVIVFNIAELLIYGFGIWWVNYLYVWPLLVLLVLIFRARDNALFWAIFSAFYGLAFGALCSVPYLFIGGIGTAAAYFASGIIFDVVHCILNFILALMLYRPLRTILDRIYSRFAIR